MKPLRKLVLATALALAMGAVQANDGAAQAESPPDSATLQDGTAVPPIDPLSLPVASQRSGREIYESFRSGLADPECDAAATNGRWKQQFRHAAGQLAKPDDDLLPLFGYVVDSLRAAHLPTEFALIPFVESGYKPAARNASGPAGLWQFIGVTARNHGVSVREGYDGRLSPVDSTQAAVRYLKTLHGMFGGDWRLAVMGYNAGEYRILQSMRRAGMNAQNADPASLPGLSGVTYSYVEKLHALACIFQQADDREEWLRTLDRPVPLLAAHTLPTETKDLDAWARQQGHDQGLLRRLNPALTGKLSAREGKPLRVLAPSGPGATAPPNAAALIAQVPQREVPPSPHDHTEQARPAVSVATRSHTVSRGESAWTIARRYGLQPQQLLKRNGLAASAVLQPGMVLKIEKETAEK